jgi:hypothetical protein
VAESRGAGTTHDGSRSTTARARAVSSSGMRTASAVLSAVGADGERRQPRTSNTASTSTGASSGSAATPTAERA